jgi:flagellar biosynthesis/type III secretory pathway protein FliH
MNGFASSDHAADLPVSPWIVRGEVIDARRQAEDILAAAKASAGQMRADADARADALREAARLQGLSDGMSEAAALVAGLCSDLETYRSARETELSALAFAIAHRILGAFAEEDRLIRAVQTALEEHRNVTGLRLRASVEIEPVLRTMLTEAGDSAYVTIDVDETAPSGTCTLVHPRGRIAVGPIDQLRALFAATTQQATP